MSEQTETKTFWHIREIGTGESVEAVEVRPGMSDREEERLLRGMLLNLDTERFYVDTRAVTGDARAAAVPQEARRD